MTYNLFKLKLDTVTYSMRVEVCFGPKGWCYNIDNFSIYPRFSIELNEQNEWIQSAGTIQIVTSLIQQIGDQLESNFRDPFVIADIPT